MTTDENKEGSAPGPRPAAPGMVLFGGTFDPPHLGHLLAAQDVSERFGLKPVCFIPAARNPLKAAAPHAADEHRLAMLRAVAAGDDRFEVLDWELHTGGPSYSVETVRRARETYPGVPLYWLLGADQFAGLADWRESRELAGMVTFLCVARPGAPAPCASDVPGMRWLPAGNRMVDIRSSEIRKRLKAGMPVDFFLPPVVISYIQNHELYSARPTHR